MSPVTFACYHSVQAFRALATFYLNLLSWRKCKNLFKKFFLIACWLSFIQKSKLIPFSTAQRPARLSQGA
jgi:hypothetical protein